METAKSGDRARAANALARAFLRSAMAPQERRAAHVALIYLLDDPSPRVRLALAEVMATSSEAPRGLVVSLAEDQPEIAALPILNSPVLTDADLVDLAGRGSAATRALIASRPGLSRGVAAALAEIGDAEEVVVLLENATAQIAGLTLKRIAERHGAHDGVRSLLLERADLPAAVRQLLVQCVAEALSGSAFVRAAIGVRRIERVTREAGHAATIAILGTVTADELPVLVEHLRAERRLTPAFLMQALCLGRTDFFAAAMTLLSGVEERRVRSILATARHHAVRALIESAGLAREVSALFVEAILLWRNAVQSVSEETDNIAPLLVERLHGFVSHSPSAAELIEMVAKLSVAEERRRARDYATGLALVA